MKMEIALTLFLAVVMIQLILRETRQGHMTSAAATLIMGGLGCIMLLFGDLLGHLTDYAQHVHVLEKVTR
jgi:hypothetical protein